MSEPRKCPEGLMTKEAAIITKDGNPTLGDALHEYRCELHLPHEGYHEDGNFRWLSY